MHTFLKLSVYKAHRGNCTLRIENLACPKLLKFGLVRLFSHFSKDINLSFAELKQCCKAGSFAYKTTSFEDIFCPKGEPQNVQSCWHASSYMLSNSKVVRTRSLPQLT